MFVSIAEFPLGKAGLYQWSFIIKMAKETIIHWQTLYCFVQIAIAKPKLFEQRIGKFECSQGNLGRRTSQIRGNLLHKTKWQSRAKPHLGKV